MEFQDYYKTLGVERGATPEQIRRAYRKLAREHHPDVSKDPQAQAKFARISEAYEVLKDPEKRQRYDRLGEQWKAGEEFRPPPGYEHFQQRRGGPRAGGFEFTGGDFSDFFRMFFEQEMGGRAGGGGRGFSFEGFGPGGGAHAEAPPLHEEAELTISLEEAHRGARRQIGLRNPTDGQTRTLEVKIPAGATQGAKIRLRGQGSRGGDLLLKINLAPHPRFEVEEADLTTELKLAPWEAALGAKLEVPTLEGEVTLTIPPGAQSGQKLRLRGKGLARRRDQGQGDLLVRLKIVVPKKLSEEERTLFEQLRERSSFDARK